MDAHQDRFHARVRKLVGIALARLPSLVDPATGLAVFRADGEDLTPSGTSLRYTAMAALGVEKAMEHGLACDLSLGNLHEALDATLAAADNAGDVGLVLWAAARHSPALAERALDALARMGEIEQRPGCGMVHTTELAWVTTGLAEALSAGVGDERDVRARLDHAFSRLLDQRGPSGLMCFARPKDGHRSLAPRAFFQGEFGFFDAQVYTIVACLRRDAVLADPAARDAARVIGERLLQHQHRQGQWGWRYNVRTGALVDLYPVYSVHQDGMAPMALLPLERAVGLPFTAAVARGVDWLFGDNELGEPLADVASARIWRSIRRRDPLRGLVHPLQAASLLRAPARLDLGARFAGPRSLIVDRELRPYHLGFCLLAFSDLAAAHREHGEGLDPRPTLRTGDVDAASRRHRASNSA
jgi:hypothetical protein